MSNAKNVLLKLLSGTGTDSVAREELLDRAETFSVKRGDAVKALKLADPSCYIKRNPIVYDREKLISSLNGTLKPVRGRGAKVEEATTANFTITAPAVPALKTTQAMSDVKYLNTVIDATLDPTLDKFFPTRSYKHVKRRMNPNFPLNIFIYGETGVGKSTSVLHAAKGDGRIVVRANLSKFADIDDLFGGLRIVDGSTFFDKGPALVAMELGAVLLLDECDSADPQLLTDLHPVLERKGYLIKKLKTMVYPAAGFCVIATANTNGRGDMQGKYIGVGPLNAAFLDRFATGIEYLPPTRAELKHIIDITLPHAPAAIVDGMCDWYEQVDASVTNGAVQDRPSPRKVLDIIELMMSDGVQLPSDAGAKECIIEGTNLMDKNISQALAELWDAMLVTKAAVSV